MSKSKEEYREELLKAATEALKKSGTSYSLETYVDSVIAYYVRTDNFNKEIKNLISVLTGLKGTLRPEQLIPMQIPDHDQRDPLSTKKKWENAVKLLRLQPHLIRDGLLTQLVAALRITLSEATLKKISKFDILFHAIDMIEEIEKYSEEIYGVTAKEFLEGKIRYFEAAQGRFDRLPSAFRVNKKNMLSLDQFETKPPLSEATEEAAS